MDQDTTEVMARLDRFGQHVGLEMEVTREGRARRFVAWGRVIEFTVLEDGLVRAAALVDDEIMAASTKPVDSMEELILSAAEDQRAAASESVAAESRAPESPESSAAARTAASRRRFLPSQLRSARRPLS